MRPSFYTDEDVGVRVAEFLRARGYDAISARNANRLEESDADQLRYAARQGWTVITHNAKHFRRLHEEWGATGQAHAGILTLDRPPKPRLPTPEEFAARIADLLATPDLVLANALWRWRGNNQWRQYPNDRG